MLVQPHSLRCVQCSARIINTCGFYGCLCYSLTPKYLLCIFGSICPYISVLSGHGRRSSVLWVGLPASAGSAQPEAGFLVTAAASRRPVHVHSTPTPTTTLTNGCEWSGTALVHNAGKLKFGADKKGNGPRVHN
jgi:hypothetical protein